MGTNFAQGMKCMAMDHCLAPSSLVSLALLPLRSRDKTRSPPLLSAHLIQLQFSAGDSEPTQHAFTLICTSDAPKLFTSTRRGYLILSLAPRFQGSFRRAATAHHQISGSLWPVSTRDRWIVLSSKRRDSDIRCVGQPPVDGQRFAVEDQAERQALGKV